MWRPLITVITIFFTMTFTVWVASTSPAGDGSLGPTRSVKPQMAAFPISAQSTVSMEDRDAD